MTRDEALLKLLAVEPETKIGLIVATGWGEAETASVLKDLMAQGKVGYRNGRHAATRIYFPRAETEGSSGALPGSAGEGGKSVRNRRGGLVREERGIQPGWFGQAHPAGSGEEAAS
jgi:hypothetical protein